MVSYNCYLIVLSGMVVSLSSFIYWLVCATVKFYLLFCLQYL